MPRARTPPELRSSDARGRARREGGLARRGAAAAAGERGDECGRGGRRAQRGGCWPGGAGGLCGGGGIGARASRSVRCTMGCAQLLKDKVFCESHSFSLFFIPASLQMQTQ
jgi:hypothetical protein